MDKPLISYFVFSYNQEEFICDAIESAFAQTYEPLEIIFSDDCSPDRTFETIQKEVGNYDGPHTIILNRNCENVGLASSINAAFKMAKGQFFVMAAGDDISLPERTEMLVKRWQNKDDPVDLVCSYFEEMDIDSEPTGFIEKNVVFVPDATQPVRKWSCGATGACAAYSRNLIEKYGPLDERIIAEDWVFSFRAWLESGIGLIKEPLVRHRTHDNSVSIIHRNVNHEKDKRTRRIVRAKAAGDKLARAKDWFQAWQLAGKYKDDRIEADFRLWTQQLELEWEAHYLSRYQAFKVAMKLLTFQNGGKSALRIIIRQVLGEADRTASC